MDEQEQPFLQFDPRADILHNITDPSCRTKSERFVLERIVEIAGADSRDFLCEGQ
jgi:hypothetical protein